MELNGKFVQYETTDNLSLEGFLNESDNKDVAVIHLHGMGSYFWSSVGLEILNKCQEENIACFIINNRGRGPIAKIKSTVSKDNDLWAGTGYEIFEDCIKDIAGAIECLKKKGYRKFVLSGHSTGSQKILYYGLNSECENILGFMFLAAGDDFNLLRDKYTENFEATFEENKRNYDNKELFRENSGTGYFSSKRWYDLVKQDSLEGNLFNYKTNLNHINKIKQPILAIFGEDEQHAIIPPKDMLEKISKNFTNNKSRTAIVPGDHSFKTGEKELVDKINNWIKTLV